MRNTIGDIAVMVILMFLSSAAMVWYIGLRLRRWLGVLFGKKKFLGKWFWPLQFGGSLLLVGLGLFYKYNGWRIPQIVGSYVFGFVLISVMLYLVNDLAYGIMRITVLRGGRWKQQKKRLIRISGGFVVILSLILMLYGSWVAMRVKTTEYRVSVPKGSSVGGLHAVLVSDIHMGGIIGYEKVEKMVDKVNSLHPDVVFLAGDLFDGNFNEIREPEKIAALLDRIESRYGVYACWGNHDIGRTFDKMKAMIRSTRVVLLEDEARTVADLFTVVGRRDANSADMQGGAVPIEEVMKGADRTKPIILLDHEPVRLEEDSATGADLILCGHTHNGQIFPGNLIVPLFNEFSYGMTEKNGASVIVSSGYGTWGPPIRLASVSEVVSIRIDMGDR